MLHAEASHAYVVLGEEARSCEEWGAGPCRRGEGARDCNRGGRGSHDIGGRQEMHFRRGDVSRGHQATIQKKFREIGRESVRRTNAQKCIRGGGGRAVSGGRQEMHFRRGAIRGPSGDYPQSIQANRPIDRK